MPDDTTKQQFYRYVVRSITVANPRDPLQVEQAIQREIAYFVEPVRIVSMILVHNSPQLFSVSGTGAQFLLVIEGQRTHD